MYSKSKRIHSSKLLMWLRPMTCQRQVIPGVTLSLRRLPGFVFFPLVWASRARTDQAHISF